MKKRIFALLLTLCMVVSMLPAQMVFAEGTDEPVIVEEPPVAEESTEEMLVAAQEVAAADEAGNIILPEVTWYVTADAPSIAAGESVMLYVYADNGEAITEGVNWYVDDESVATINGADTEATLTGVSEGYVTVTAQGAVSDTSATAVIEITAAEVPDDEEVTEITSTLNPSERHTGTIPAGSIETVRLPDH